MFRSLMIIIRELYLYLTKVIFMLKHSVKLRRAARVLCALQTTRVPLYSLTLHCTQHTCRSTVSLLHCYLSYLPIFVTYIYIYSYSALI